MPLTDHHTIPADFDQQRKIEFWIIDIFSCGGTIKLIFSVLSAFFRWTSIKLRCSIVCPIKIEKNLIRLSV